MKKALFFGMLLGTIVFSSTQGWSLIPPAQSSQDVYLYQNQNQPQNNNFQGGHLPGAQSAPDVYQPQYQNVPPQNYQPQRFPPATGAQDVY